MPEHPTQTDTNHMPHYLAQIAPARPAMLNDGPTPEESQAIAAHFEYLQAQVAQSAVLMAGRTLEEAGGSNGFVLMEVATLAQAKALMAGDPAISSGVMRLLGIELFRVALWRAEGPRQL